MMDERKMPVGRPSARNAGHTFVEFSGRQTPRPASPEEIEQIKKRYPSLYEPQTIDPPKPDMLNGSATDSQDPHVVWHQQQVTRADREQLTGHRGCVVWFTGLSGCGKSTIANEVDRQLHELGVHTYLLDGDNVRHGLNAGPGMLKERHGEAFAQRFGLGFGAEDREENIRRIGAVAQLFCDAGLIVLTAFVSPYRRDRDAVRAMLSAGGESRDFIEVFVDAPLEVCEARDPKGLYKKARAGEIANFTGISDPYEPPLAPELVLASAAATPPELAAYVVAHLRQCKVIGASSNQ